MWANAPKHSETHLRRKFVEADIASKGEDGYAKIGIHGSVKMSS